MTNIPMDEKALFGSTWAWLISFFTLCDQISSCVWMFSWSSLSWITLILFFYFKQLIKRAKLKPPAFSITKHKLHLGVCLALLTKLLIFFNN